MKLLSKILIFLSLKNSNSYHGNINISKCLGMPTANASNLKSALSNCPESIKTLLPYPNYSARKNNIWSYELKNLFILIKLVAMVTKLFQLDAIFFIILKDLTSYENILKK